MNNKKLLVSGLAVVGAIALFMYLKPKPKRNSEGFFGADGKMNKMGSGGCRVCRGASNDYYAVYGQCRQGDSCRDKVMSTN
jgi:hypothetical protein